MKDETATYLLHLFWLDNTTYLVTTLNKTNKNHENNEIVYDPNKIDKYFKFNIVLYIIN